MATHCPMCGSIDFEQTRTTRTLFQLSFAQGQWVEQSEEVIDGGDFDDGEITCSNCSHIIQEDNNLCTCADPHLH